MKITRLHYNWYYSAECGEDYEIAEVGKAGVVKIESQVEGNGLRWIISYKDRNVEVIYNPNKVFLNGAFI